MEIVNYIAENVMGMTCLTGMVFFIAAIITYLFPPKKINYFYGYRTSRSMKNQKVWDFAQRFSSLKMMQGGIFLILISFLKLIFSFSDKIELILSFLLIIGVVIYFFIVTERAIKAKFPNQ